MSTYLPGYDAWKTTPPEEEWDGKPEEVQCEDCKQVFASDEWVRGPMEDDHCPHCGGIGQILPQCSVCGTNVPTFKDEFCSRRCSKAAASPYY